MKVFRVTLSYDMTTMGIDEVSRTNFHFDKESSAHEFFAWLSQVYGVMPAFGVAMASDVEIEDEPEFDRMEDGRREMVWDHWYQYHNGPPLVH